MYQSIFKVFSNSNKHSHMTKKKIITDCRSQKAVSANPITDTNLFKAFFISCRIMYSATPISIFRHVFRA